MRSQHRKTLKRLLRMALILWLCGTSLVGCRTPSDHRRWADEEVACIVNQRECDPSWNIPSRRVEADPRSRMADWNDPDCGALPPDDPAAHSFMHCADCRPGWPCWHHRGDLPSIEFPDWKQHLETDEEGVLVVTRENVMELALLHSRDYQTQFERLYFSALSLSAERFDFDHQWFGRSSTFSDISGNGPPNGSEVLSIDNAFGFSKNLVTGGQLLANVANSFVWEFSGGNVSAASGGILVALTQPVLRGAFREVRMESLTQAERNVLYELRDFARFRRAFFVDSVGSNGYLGLLAVSQAIKNERTNLEALERNLEEHEKLVAAGLVAPIQVDQIFQQYQQGRLNLLSAQQDLEATLDQFKLQLGLPPQLKIRLDEDSLSPFELSSTDLDDLGDRNEELRLAILQFDEEPSAEFIEKGLKQVESQQSELNKLYTEIESEWERWKQRFDEEDKPTGVNEKEVYDRERDQIERLKEILDDVKQGLDEDSPRLKKALERLANPEASEKDKPEEPDRVLSSEADELQLPDDTASDLLDDSKDAPVIDPADRDAVESALKKVSQTGFVEKLRERVSSRRISKVRHAQFVAEIPVDEDAVSVPSNEIDIDSGTPKTNDGVAGRGDVAEDSFLDDPDAASTDADAPLREGDLPEPSLLDELDAPNELDASDWDDPIDVKAREAEKEAVEERERKARIAKESPWEALQELVGQEFRKHLAELFVVQTQIRVFLIEVNDVDMESDEAVAIALQKRLDLMNQRGVVVDTYRQIIVAADGLEADLGIRLEAELGTDPGRANPVRFDASANRYRVGIEFDSPLTRLLERNGYRSAQIVHQQARRDFMALQDQIVAQVRADIRSLRFNRFRFDIAQQQLIVAARQVDEAQVNLRNATEPNSSFTRDLLNALQGLLDSKNNLIQSWVNYETSRMNLFRDLELMNIAPEGTWINEYDEPASQAFSRAEGASPSFNEEADVGRQFDFRGGDESGLAGFPLESAIIESLPPLEPLP